MMARLPATNSALMESIRSDTRSRIRVPMVLSDAFGAAYFFAANRAVSWEISFLRAVSDSSVLIRSRSSASLEADCIAAGARAYICPGFGAFMGACAPAVKPKPSRETMIRPNSVRCIDPHPVINQKFYRSRVIAQNRFKRMANPACRCWPVVATDTIRYHRPGSNTKVQ